MMRTRIARLGSRRPAARPQPLWRRVSRAARAPEARPPPPRRGPPPPPPRPPIWGGGEGGNNRGAAGPPVGQPTVGPAAILATFFSPSPKLGSGGRGVRAPRRGTHSRAVQILSFV